MILKRITNRLMRDHHRRRATTKLRQSSVPLASTIAEALERATAPPDAAARKWQSSIEELRQQLSQNEEVLESWDRPWLLRSEELQDRVGIEVDAQDTTTTVSGGMTVSQAVLGSKDPPSCRVLFELVRALQPRAVVELGTNVGISGCYIAAALTEANAGQLTTLEGSPSMCAWADKHFHMLGVDDRVEIVNGDFFDKLDGVIEQHGESIDLAFIDGFHDSEATIEFHEKFKRAAGQAILIYDDIRWSSGMEQAWNRIISDPLVSVSVDANYVGMCVVGESAPKDEPVHVTWSK